MLRVLLIVGGSVVLALVSFAVAVAVTGDPLGLRSQAVASTVATVPPATAAPTTAAAPTTVTSTTQAALVPPGWGVHTDPATGYQVAIPPGWQVVSDGGPRTELRDQSSPTFLRIDWLQDPRAVPVTLEQQADQAHAGERGGYQRARLGTGPVQGPARRRARVHLSGRRDLARPRAGRPLATAPRRHGHPCPRPGTGAAAGPCSRRSRDHLSHQRRDRFVLAANG